MNEAVIRNTKTEKGVIAAIAAMLLDQIHKFYMLEIFHMEDVREVTINQYFNLVMVWNKGISFGMFHGHAYSNYFFMFFTTSIIIILFFFMRSAKTRAEAIAFGTIIGGASGNLIDRFRLHAVADFFDFHYGNYHWPSFNIADSCVFIGAMILIATSLFKKPEVR